MVQRRDRAEAATGPFPPSLPSENTHTHTAAETGLHKKGGFKSLRQRCEAEKEPRNTSLRSSTVDDLNASLGVLMAGKYRTQRCDVVYDHTDEMSEFILITAPCTSSPN